LGNLLWGEIALHPKDPAPSLRELMTYVKKRHGDKWTIDDNGRGFRISPRSRPATPEPAYAIAVALIGHALQLRDPGFGFAFGPKADQKTGGAAVRGLD